MKSNRFDNIIAMNLLTLAVLTAGYGASIVTDIPAMRAALSQPNQGKRLVPMPEPVEFKDGKAVIVRK